MVELNSNNTALKHGALTVDEIFSVIPDLLFLLNSNYTILEYRAGKTSDLYIAPEKFLGKSLYEVLPPPTAKLFCDAIKQSEQSRALIVIEYQLPINDKIKWFEARISYSSHERIIILAREISELKHEQIDTLHRAQHDALTDVYNRSYAIDYLNQQLEYAKAQQHAISIFFIDIDNFKELNDQYGHEYGDGILIVVANSIRTSIRKSDLVARLGGDEFLAVLNGCRSTQELTSIADKIIAKLDSYAEKCHTCISVSIGIASCENGCLSSSELIRRADMAMYESKQAGKHTTTIFREQIC